MRIERLNNSIQSWIYPIARVTNHIASVTLFFMMLLTITDVILRKTISKSILGTVEVTEFMMVILVFFTLAQTEILDGHVKVDLIISRFSARVQAFVDMVTQFICFLLFVLFTWSVMVYAGEMKASGEVSQDLWLPIYPFIYVVAVGCALLSIALFIKFLIALMRTTES
ncbi:MAG: TRAP transporter small permease [Deltaproteobacteria bacterium]|nr:TRAP transporter small permease [Deltaproteobacteria bacterium]